MIRPGLRPATVMSRSRTRGVSSGVSAARSRSRFQPGTDDEHGLVALQALTDEAEDAG